jgi:hypothetical protein
MDHPKTNFYKEPKKRDKAAIEGAAKIGIEVQKEKDFSTWYQQVIDGLCF